MSIVDDGASRTDDAVTVSTICATRAVGDSPVTAAATLAAVPCDTPAAGAPVESHIDGASPENTVAPSLPISRTVPDTGSCT